MLHCGALESESFNTKTSPPHATLYTQYRLRLQGVPDAAVGGARACTAVLGLLGTMVFPTLAARYGLAASGMISVWLQVSSHAMKCQKCIAAASHHDFNNTLFDSATLCFSQLEHWLQCCGAGRHFSNLYAALQPL
jgi:Ferroportin1 (FPN1)